MVCGGVVLWVWVWGSEGVFGFLWLCNIYVHVIVWYFLLFHLLLRPRGRVQTVQLRLKRTLGRSWRRLTVHCNIFSKPWPRGNRSWILQLKSPYATSRK